MDADRSIEGKIQSAIDALDPDEIEAGDLEEIAKRIASAHVLKCPELDKSGGHISDQEDCKVDVSKDRNRSVSDRSKPCMVDGKRIVVSIPLTGDATLLSRKPTGPNGLSHVDLNVHADRIELTYLRPLPIDKDLFNRDMTNDINAVSSNMGFVTAGIDSVNRELVPIALQKLKARKSSILAGKNVLEGLSLPVRLKEKTTQPEPAPSVNRSNETKRRKSMLKLTIGLEEAERKIDAQLDKANAIRNRDFNSKSDIDKAFDETERWTKFTHALLSQMFGSDQIADEFSDWFKIGHDSDIGIAHIDSTLQQSTQFFYDNLDPKINRLTSIRERLELYGASSNPSTKASIASSGDTTHEYDVFICHASEDKLSVATPLANELTAKGLSVWYDKFAIKLGDSLRGKIDEGLLKSRYGLVILSPAFFKKQWTKHELDGLTQKEMRGVKVILPIWHDVSHNDVFEYSPTLAGKLASGTSDMAQLVQDILEVVQKK